MTAPDTNLNYAGCGCTTASTDRCTLSSLVCREGVAFGNAGDLEVYDGDAMCVNVRRGNAFVQGDSGQPAGTSMYHVCDSQRADTQLCLATSDPTDDRIDLIVMCVADSDFEGDECAGSVGVVTGTPSPTPVAPDAGPNCIPLAEVLVAGGSTEVQPADITDRRQPYELCSPGLFEPYRRMRAGNAQVIPNDAITPLTGWVNDTGAPLNGSIVYDGAGVFRVVGEGRYWVELTVAYSFGSSTTASDVRAILTSSEGAQVETRTGKGSSGVEFVSPTASGIFGLPAGGTITTLTSQNTGSGQSRAQAHTHMSMTYIGPR